MPTWEELRAGVYELDGSWRDIYVLDTTREDWRHWMTCVNRHYPVRWGAVDYQEDQTMDAIDVAYIDSRWEAGEGTLTSWCTVFLDQVEVKCHFFTYLEIEQDIDPSQIQSVADHERLMAYLVTISCALHKEVIVTAENVPEGIYIRVNGTDIHLMQGLQVHS